jgi:hypothetical protein
MQSRRECSKPGCSVNRIVADVAPASTTSIVEVVLNLATARGSPRKTCRGVPMARRRITSECASPVCSAAAPTRNINCGSPTTSVAAANSRIRVS